MRFRGRGEGLLSGEDPDEAAEQEPRKCLVEGTYGLGIGMCKQFGSDACRWNTDAIVDCPYVRGDDVDVTEWIVSDG